MIIIINIINKIRCKKPTQINDNKCNNNDEKKENS